ncbi:hypothetical protein GCM10009647_033980 [Streptomyces sanglieri]|uniref:Uncharacterized protein n=1 Tax=Streptomyces sanglieri TaxID=193460 RepID=A0ABW2WQC7_9ACTN|nr:hypothetical protein [Streptomyces sp. Wh19]MDV9194616.1 hypothetical protein [Streptomyces sp. Wh19]
MTPDITPQPVGPTGHADMNLQRQGFVCTMNTTDEAVRIPAPGHLLLAGFPIGPTNGSHGASFELDANATVWWTV